MDKDYLVFWYDGNDMRTSVVRVATPPHETVRGDALANLLKEALDSKHAAENFTDLDINGAVELPAAVWVNGGSLDIIDGNGAAAVLEVSQCAWRIVQ